RGESGSPLATQSFALPPASGASAAPGPWPSGDAPGLTGSPRVAVVTPSAAFRDDLSRLEVEARQDEASGSSVAGERPRRVVLLDDDEAIQRILPGLVEGPDLAAAAGPWRGDPAAFAAAQGPDLILLDVDANEKSATERLQRLRQEPRLERVPVVLFSSA